ncbi:MAG: winged helix-turn-helix domain-containing protein [Nitrososphaeria archaeon]
MARRPRGAIDARAYLSGMRNTGRGLETRSGIIRVLMIEGPARVSEISSVLPRCDRTVRRHLRKMEDRGIAVKIREKRPFTWNLSGVGQQSLEESLRS